MMLASLTGINNYLKKVERNPWWSLLLLGLLFAGFIFYSPITVKADPSLITSIDLGNRPQGVAFNASNNLIYIADTNGGMGNTVQVIDSLTHAIVTTITVGYAPTGIAVNQTTNKIYVANSNNGTVSVISGTTNTVVATITLINTNTNWVAVNPQTNRIYVTASGGGRSIVGVIDGNTDRLLKTIPVGNGPQGIAVNPVTNRVYVAEYAGPGVAVIDGNSNTLLSHVSGFSGYGSPYGIGVNSVTNRIYATKDNNTVAVIDGASNSVISNISTPAIFGGVAVNPAANRIYITAATDYLSVINGNSNTVINTIPLGTGGLYGMDFNSNTSQLYITDYNGRKLHVLSDVVIASPTIVKSFSDNSIALNGSTSLSFTITNPNTTKTLTGIGFSDNFPDGLQIAATSNLSSTCNGTVSAPANGSSLVFSGGTLAASNSCTIKVEVTGVTPGSKDNVTTVITSTESGPGATSNHAYLAVQNNPTAISATAGTPQNTFINTAFSTNLQAKVVNANGTPVSGTLVIFQAPGTGPGGTFSTGGISTTVTTNSGGLATAPTFTANNLDGSFTVTATVEGLITPASFSLTSLPVYSGEGESVAYQINATHTGAITLTNFTAPLSIKWSVDLGGVTSYPIIAQGKVYVLAENMTNYHESLYALDATNGEIVWGPIDFATHWANATYDKGKIFIQTDSGTLFAYDATYGMPLWSKSLPGQYAFSSPPTAYKGVIYTGGAGTGGTVYAVRESDGTLLWTASVANGDHSSPAVTDDGVYVSYACPNVYKLNPVNGAQIWHPYSGCTGGGGRTPVLYNGKLYIRDTGLGVILDSTNGSTLGSFPYGPIPAFANEKGFFSHNGVLDAYNASTQELLWSVSGSFVTAPLVINGLVFVGTNTGDLYVYDTESGVELWHGNAGAAISGPEEHNLPTSLTGFGAGEGLLVVPASNRIVAFGPSRNLQITAPSEIVAGTAFSTTVTAKDNTGQVIPGYQGTVHFTSTDAQAVLPADYTFVAADTGSHSFNVTLKSAGIVSLLVTDTTGTNLSVTTTVKVISAAPAMVAVNSGANQSGEINATFSLPLTAKVTDSFGNVISGTLVTFEAPNSGTSGTFKDAGKTTSVTTNSGGIAVAPDFTANDQSGSYVVTASVTGIATTANFSLTNLPATSRIGESVAYQVNAAHTGAITMTNFTTPLKVKWSADLGGAASYPIITEGKVYIIVRNDQDYGVKLYALDAGNGAVAWGPISIATTYYWANATYENGMLFVQTYSGNLLAFDAGNGTQLWNKKLPGQYAFSSPPTAYGGVIYTGGAGSGGTVYAVRESDGTLLWTASVANGDHSSPAVTDDGVYVSYACPNVYKLNPTTGAQIWHPYVGCSGGGGKTPVLYGGKLYVRDYGGTYILNAVTGDTLGSFPYGPIPAFAGGIGYFNHGGTLEAHDTSTQNLLWSVPGSFVTAPLVINGFVIVGTGEGDLYAYAAVTGEEKWHGTAGSGINYPDEQNVSQPLTGLGAGQGLLVVPAGSRVVAFEAWSVSTYSSNPTTSSTFDVGHVSVGTTVSATLTISNTGQAALMVSSPQITGTNAADFTVDTAAFPLNIGLDGTTRQVSVSCNPSSSGTRTATLSFVTNDPQQPSVSYGLSCTGTYAVTELEDNGQGDTPGTLSYWLTDNRVASGETISISLPSGSNTLTIKHALPPIPAGVKIEGGCGADGPTVILKAASDIEGNSAGLILSGDDTLFGLEIEGFPGRAIGNTGSGNHLSCVRAVK